MNFLKKKPEHEYEIKKLLDGCMKIVYDTLKFLTKPYELQYEEMEDFARWNLPEDTGLTWIDVSDVFLPHLIEYSVISEEEISLLQSIINNFDNAFKLEQKEYEVIWSHESMKNHPFWENQRNLAKQALILFEEQNASNTGD